MLDINRINSSFEYRFEGKALQTNIDFFNQDLEQIEEKYAFVIEDKDDCTIISQILNTSIICETKESDIENKNLAIIKVINKGDKYDIKLQQNEIFQVFDSSLLSTESFVDLFLSPDSYESYLDIDSYEYKGYNENYNKFLQLQSVMSKFLIKKKVKIMKINIFY